MIRTIHPILGTVAFLTIAAFWLSTVATEAFGSHDAVVALKTNLPWGFLLLVPALVGTAASGTVLAQGTRRGPIGAKAKRMPIIAANGLAILVPSALYLASKASVGEFDAGFYAIQGIELVAGATNLALLGMGMRDGFTATAWKRSSLLRAAPTRSTRVVSVEEIAGGTIAVRLEKPAGFTYRAGQALYLMLGEAAAGDDGGRIRTFSIASAPHEEHLLLATRVGSSAFKSALRALKPGASVVIDGPYGDLVVDPTGSRPVVFLAGGIGITPFRSLIVDALHRGLSRGVLLVYINRTSESAAFLPELSALQGRHPSFRLAPMMSEVLPHDSAENGARGHVTRGTLEAHVGELSAPTYVIAGPSSMVAAMQTLLRDAGVNPRDISAEMFSGY